MATKAEQRREAIIEFLTSNPGSHAIDQIATGCTLRVSDTARALDQLCQDGMAASAEPEADGNPRWVLAAQGAATGEPDDQAATEESNGTTETDSTTAAESDGAAGATEEAADTEPEPEGTTTAEEQAATVAAGTEAAESGHDQTPDSTDTGGDVPADDTASEEAVSEVDPDPAVLLLSAQLAVCEGPIELEAITKAAFKVVGPKQLETTLHALCALAEHGAVECSAPYAPDDRDRDDKASWTVAVDAAELDRIAGIAQLADAPVLKVCPTCHTELAMPRPKGTGRKTSGANERGDGRRRLADGELRGMLQTLIQENPGEELKPGDFVRELKNDPRFKDRVSANPSGAVRSALIALERPEHGEWVAEIGGRTPLTYRCREAK